MARANELASVDGTISPTAEATVPLTDDGLYRGDGVFEVIRLYEGRPFALGEHLDRLERSAAAIELDRRPRRARARDRGAAGELGDADGAAAAGRHPRRAPHRRSTEPLPRPRRAIALATVTYSPDA